MAREKKVRIQRTPEEIAQLRKERAEKKARRQAEIARQLAEEQENIVHQALTSKQENRWEVKRRLEARHDYLRGRRKAYLLDRDLDKAKLEETEINEFIGLLDYWFKEYEESIQKILTEMLKYPEPRLNDAAYRFLTNLLEKGPMGMSFWVYAWNREFVPNDLMEIMDERHLSPKHGLTGYAKELRESCAHIILPREIKKHLLWEEERLEAAKQITDEIKREKQIARVTARIQKMKHLINDVYVR